jgi:hypothetical protein
MYYIEKYLKNVYLFSYKTNKNIIKHVKWIPLSISNTSMEKYSDVSETDHSHTDITSKSMTSVISMFTAGPRHYFYIMQSLN